MPWRDLKVESFLKTALLKESITLACFFGYLYGSFRKLFQVSWSVWCWTVPLFTLLPQLYVTASTLLNPEKKEKSFGFKLIFSHDILHKSRLQFRKILGATNYSFWWQLLEHWCKLGQLCYHKANSGVS